MAASSREGGLVQERDHLHQDWTWILVTSDARHHLNASIAEGAGIV